MSEKKNEVKKDRVVTDAELRQWVSNDIASAVSMLNMLRNDPEILKAIQDIVISRVRTEEENKKAQPELDLNGVN